MEFIGRDRELRAMNALYNSGRFEFLAIYGRRRVGKTSLIREFIGDRDAIFISARRERGDYNIRALRQAVAERVPSLKDDADIDEILDALSSPSMGRLILALDEFPYMVESVDGIMGALQCRIDSAFKNSKLMLILCGSSMSFMERQVLGHESPLYGRRTAEIKLKPMDYYESSLFFWDRSAYEKACIFGAVGGIPMYLDKFSSGDIWEIMAKEFLETGFTLASEPESLLMQEMRDPMKYNALIEAIANGYSRISDISAKTKMVSPEVSRLLDDLIDLDYVEKVTPLGEPAGRRTRYFLKDNLFKFYYSNVYNNENRLRGRSGRESAERIRDATMTYMGYAFESICGEYMMRSMDCESTGRWWKTISKDTTAEIDLIGIRRPSPGTREGLVAECKFRNEEMSESTLRKLKDSAELLGGFDLKRYVLFSRGGFTDRLRTTAEHEGVLLIELDDLYIGMFWDDVSETSLLDGEAVTVYRRTQQGFVEKHESGERPIGMADMARCISESSVRGSEVLMSIGEVSFRVVERSRIAIFGDRRVPWTWDNMRVR